jgi:hypothetical protein
MDQLGVWEWNHYDRFSCARISKFMFWKWNIIAAAKPLPVEDYYPKIKIAMQ